MKSAREQVVEIIDRFYKTTLDLKTIQNNNFKQYDPDTIDRNRIIVLSREILRWKGRLDIFISKFLDHPIYKLQSQLLVILELATYELLFDDKVPNYAAINSAVDLTKRKFNKKTAGLVNAVLRKIGHIDAPSVSGSASNSSRQSIKFIPRTGSPPIPMHVVWPRSLTVVW